MNRWAALVVAGLANAAFAWPVDWLHEVDSGREKFIKLPKVDWLEVDEPATLHAEWVEPTNELVLIGLKPGTAMMLLGADGKVAAWRVRVGTKPIRDDKLFAAAQKACPDLKATPLEDIKLTATVTTEACRVALLALFQNTDLFEARHLELNFERAVLQTQLKLVQSAIDSVAKGRVTASYVGAGLVLTGTKITCAEYHRILWLVLRHTLGRFVLDPRLEIEEPTVIDAGVRPTPIAK